MQEQHHSSSAHAMHTQAAFKRKYEPREAFFVAIFYKGVLFNVLLPVHVPNLSLFAICKFSACQHNCVCQMLYVLLISIITIILKAWIIIVQVYFLLDNCVFWGGVFCWCLLVLQFDYQSWVKIISFKFFDFSQNPSLVSTSLSDLLLHFQKLKIHLAEG